MHLGCARRVENLARELDAVAVGVDADQDSALADFFVVELGFVLGNAQLP